MIAFFCSTPYQILLAMQLRTTLHAQEEAHLYVLDHFDRAQLTVGAVVGTGLFERVQLIGSRAFLATQPPHGTRRKFWRIVQYLRYRRHTQRYFDFQKAIYTDAYFTYQDVLIQLALTELKRRNSTIRVHLFEDGTRGYYWRGVHPTSIKGRLYIAVGYGKYIGFFDDILVLRPDLYSSASDVPVRRIPTIKHSDASFRNAVNLLFGVNSDVDSVEADKIFLEQPINSPLVYDRVAEVVEAVLTEEWLVKMHPRSRSTRFDPYNKYGSSQVPWEAVCVNIDLSNKTLLSYFSTAALTPNTMFGMQPRLVFLYGLRELTDLQILDPDLKRLVEKVRAGYSDPSRVLTPGSIDELRDAII